MDIAFLAPFSKGWNRMTKALFKPFNLGKWFIVGFTAFLAGLLDGHNGSGGLKISDSNKIDWGDVFATPLYFWEWLMDHPGWLTFIMFIIPVIIAIVVVLTWISSRGKFMFLDNVVHDRAKVTQPWNDYRMHGNSLFVWRLVFGIICLSIIGLFIFLFFNLAYDIHVHDFEVAAHVPSLVGIIFLALITVIVIAYVSLFLSDFIVPIMYRDNLTATQAWHKFLSIFSRHWISFILYGILILFLNIIVVIFVILAIIFTCCVGLLLLIIPYINAVVTLPISYTFRAFSVEFLEQFGPDFKIFPEQAEHIPQV